MGRLEGSLVREEQAANTGVASFLTVKVVVWEDGCALPSVMDAKLKTW